MYICFFGVQTSQTLRKASPEKEILLEQSRIDENNMCFYYVYLEVDSKGQLITNQINKQTDRQTHNKT